MTTSTHQTEITVDPDLPVIRITREFEVPPELVFRAHTEPELLVQWFGPRLHEMRIDHHDCRSGGSSRYVHVSDGNEFGFYGCFHEVRPSERIIQTSPSRGSRMAWPSSDSLRRPRQRSDPADRDVAGRLVRGTRRVRRERHGERSPGELRALG